MRAIRLLQLPCTQMMDAVNFHFSADVHFGPISVSRTLCARLHPSRCSQIMCSYAHAARAHLQRLNVVTCCPSSQRVTAATRRRARWQLAFLANTCRRTGQDSLPIVSALKQATLTLRSSGIQLQPQRRNSPSRRLAAAAELGRVSVSRRYNSHFKSTRRPDAKCTRARAMRSALAH